MGKIRLDKQARNLIGHIAERLARARLRKEGYEVQKFNHCGSPMCYECGFYLKNKKRISETEFTVNEGTYPKRCRRGKKWLKLMHYRDQVQKRITESLNLDFYAKKNGEEYVIEVKANKSRLSKAQKELVRYAKQLGYRALHIHATIDVTGKIDEIVEK